MIEVKYKAVEEHILIHINTLKKWYGVISRSNYRPVHKIAFQINNKINRFKNTTYYIRDTSTVTLEQAREKAKSQFHKTDDGKYYLRRLGDAGLDHSRYFSDLEKYTEGYIQALKDFNILKEGE